MNNIERSPTCCDGESDDAGGTVVEGRIIPAAVPLLAYSGGGSGWEEAAGPGGGGPVPHITELVTDGGGEHGFVGI